MIRVEVVADKLNASEREEDKASLTALYRSLKEKLAGMEAQAKAIGCDEGFITIDTREPVIIPAGWRKCIYCGKDFDPQAEEKEYNKTFADVIAHGKLSYMDRFHGTCCLSCAMCFTYEELERQQKYTDVVLEELFPESQEGEPTDEQKP